MINNQKTNLTWHIVDKTSNVVFDGVYENYHDALKALNVLFRSKDFPENRVIYEESFIIVPKWGE